LVTYSLKFLIVRNASGRVIYATVLCFVRDLWGYRSFVRRVICPKCSVDSEIDAKPNPNSNPNPSHNPNPNVNSDPNPSPYPNPNPNSNPSPNPNSNPNPKPSRNPNPMADPDPLVVYISRKFLNPNLTKFL